MIELHCRLADMPPSDRQQKLQDRAEWLLKANFDRWFGAVREVVGPQDISRGFVVNATGTVDEFARCADALHMLAPSLTMNIWDSTAGELAAFTKPSAARTGAAPDVS
jgi:hypothetical protein